MAITKVNNYSISDSNLSASYETLDKTRKGLKDISISNYDNDSATVVKVGSIIENLGTMYKIESADETPTGYSGILVSSIFYLYFDSSATAFIYDSVSPTWSDQYQGWYNGDDRALFSMFKDSTGALYQNKAILTHLSQRQIQDLQLEGIMKWKYSYQNDNITSALLFPILDLWVPNTNDYMPFCTGSLVGLTNRIGHIAGLNRTSSTSINIAFIRIDTVGATTNLVVNEGAAATWKINIMSNEDAITATIP